MRCRQRHSVATLLKDIGRQIISESQILQCILSTILEIMVWLSGICAISHATPLDPVNELIYLSSLAVLVQCLGGVVNNAFKFKLIVLATYEGETLRINSFTV